MATFKTSVCGNFQCLDLATLDVMLEVFVWGLAYNACRLFFNSLDGLKSCSFECRFDVEEQIKVTWCQVRQVTQIVLTLSFKLV